MQDPVTDQTATLVQVAHLYYNENMSQREIAEQLNVSRSLIALYLQRAREQGIVRITVVNPQDSCTNLALELRRHANLQHVIVVPHGHMSEDLTHRAVAAAAAQYLDSQLENGDVLGLVWGRAVKRVVELLAPTQPRDIDVVPLLGESSHINSYTEMNQLVLRTSEHFSGRPHFLLAPMLVGSQSLRDALLQDPSVRSATSLWDDLTIVCSGVGVLPPAPGQIPFLSQQDIDNLMDLGAVGDVAGIHPYDLDGNLIEGELADRTIGVSVEQMMAARVRVIVATGVEKAPGIIGAVRSGLASTLVIDARLAQAVIDELA